MNESEFQSAICQHIDYNIVNLQDSLLNDSIYLDSLVQDSLSLIDTSSVPTDSSSIPTDTSEESQQEIPNNETRRERRRRLRNQ